MDKLNEASRKQFEKWFMIKYNVTADTMKIMYFKVEIAWEAWQASRAGIVVELPKGLTTREALDLGYMGDYASGVDDGIEETAKNIRSVGLSIKGE